MDTKENFNSVFVKKEKGNNYNSNAEYDRIKKQIDSDIRHYRRALEIAYFIICCLITYDSIFSIFLIRTSDSEFSKTYLGKVVKYGIYGNFVILLILFIYLLILLMKKPDEAEYKKNLGSKLHTDIFAKQINANENKKGKDKFVETSKNVNFEKNGENRDIIAQMLKNHDETREYFTISKKHVKSSHWLAIIMSVTGFFMLCIALYGFVFTNNLNLTVISTTSGAITEMVAGLVFWIHNKSVMQLNYYYEALHETEKFLSAINIADRLGEEKREEIYTKIIERQIEIPNNEKKN